MQIRDLIPWGRDRQETPQSTVDSSNPVMNLQRDVNRAFDNLWGRMNLPFGPSYGARFPYADVTETDDAIEVAVELPGVDEKDVEISLAGDVLSIRGEKKATKQEKRAGQYISERSYGVFHRTIPLPAGVDTEKVSAKFKQGVLTINLPRSEHDKTKVKRIEVTPA